MPEENKPEITKEEEKEIQVITKTITERAPDDVMNNLTPAQIELLKKTVAKNATDDELKLFLNVCAGAKLNPYLKQVHYIKRWDSRTGTEVGTVQVGIDGFRAIAESGGQYAGSDDPIFTGEKEIEVTIGKTISKIKVPENATVTVYKLMDHQRFGFTATARWNEYYPGSKQGYMWHKMPFNQLGKCAESLALRKAFPKLLSGLYSPEEMEQAGETEKSTANSDVFAKVVGMIKKAKDVKGLGDFKAKAMGSTKFTDIEKMEILEAIEDRMKELGIITP